MRRFADRVAIVTGGAAGIGLATARRLQADGARVALLDWSAEDLERAVTDLGGAEKDVLGMRGDVADPAVCEAAVQQTVSRWGHVHLLVANAAVRAYGSLLTASDEEWEQVLAVNLRGVANICAAGARVMRENPQSRGAMVLVSSANALVGRANMPLYDAAKAGVLSLTRSLAVDLAGAGIRVNSVCPGFTVTDFHIRRAAEEGRTADDLRDTRTGLLGRPAEPDEIAAAIAFLLSEDASYITGTNLMADAGRHVT